jgi:16S rRNA processing protein RimM
MLVAKFEGIDTIEAATYLKSKDVYIDKDKLKKLEKDNYYIEDLIGMEIFENEDVYLGKLKYVYNTAANDVYEIETEKYGIIYLPAIHQVIKKVDIENKKMYVEIMEGLV